MGGMMRKILDWFSPETPHQRKRREKALEAVDGARERIAREESLIEARLEALRGQAESTRFRG